MKSTCRNKKGKYNKNKLKEIEETFQEKRIHDRSSKKQGNVKRDFRKAIHTRKMAETNSVIKENHMVKGITNIGVSKKSRWIRIK